MTSRLLLLNSDFIVFLIVPLPDWIEVWTSRVGWTSITALGMRETKHAHIRTTFPRGNLHCGLRRGGRALRNRGARNRLIGTSIKSEDGHRDGDGDALSVSITADGGFLRAASRWKFGWIESGGRRSLKWQCETKHAHIRRSLRPTWPRRTVRALEAEKQRETEDHAVIPQRDHQWIFVPAAAQIYASDKSPRWDPQRLPPHGGPAPICASDGDQIFNQEWIVDTRDGNYFDHDLGASKIGFLIVPDWTSRVGGRSDAPIDKNLVLPLSFRARRAIGAIGRSSARGRAKYRRCAATPQRKKRGWLKIASCVFSLLPSCASAQCTMGKRGRIDRTSDVSSFMFKIPRPFERHRISSFFTFKSSTHEFLSLWVGFHHPNSDDTEAYNTVTTAPNKSTLSPKLIATAASYKAAGRFEEHCEENGKPRSPEDAKKILADFTDTFIDGMGLNAITQEEVKRDAYKKNEKTLKDGGY
ncbi:hypothetical protein B0H14DRAFT_3788365 [Mycena olivaceomarginata]|nr:hypothetical protein B0H14DRAFT_3788365 [Mycena olivaceomarginata]